MIYLIMYIIDYSPEDEENARELLLALHASPTVCSCFLWLTLTGALCGVQKVRRRMFRTERGVENEYNLGRLDLCRVSTKVRLVVRLAAAVAPSLTESPKVCESVASRRMCCVCQERKRL